VLHDFAKADQDWLADVLTGISEGAPALAQGDAARFMNAVALRTQPQRPRPERPAPAAAPAPAPAPAAAPQAEPEPAPRSALQRLRDRFL
jgi:PTH1 family peptidyl-tRNA hydrolase